VQAFWQNQDQRHIKAAGYVVFALPFLGGALQRHNTENSKQILPEKELGTGSLSPIFNIYVSVSDLYISTIGPPILLQENR
jgi:hypothetical protein